MRTTLILMLLLISLPALSNPIELFKSSITQRGLGGTNSHSFCYEDESGNTEHHRGDELQRIASLTKLFLTWFALEALPKDHVWETRFWVTNESIHIEGSRDPWFEEDKIFTLISALKVLGIEQVTQVSFDHNFLFTDSPPQWTTSATTLMTQTALSRYFNPQGRLLGGARGVLYEALSFAGREGLEQSFLPVGVKATRVFFSQENPLKNSPDVRVYTHYSKTLVETLKGMNVLSKNMVAQNLWDEVRKRISIHELMNSHGISSNEYEFHSGSGLPTRQGGARLDNLASCHAVLKMLKFLENKVTALDLKIEDVVAVGTDGGSWERRFQNDSSLKSSIAAKTGTLRDSSSLAGWINATLPVRFVILNHTTALVRARQFQENFLSQWLSGSFIERDYQRTSIYPLNPDSSFMEITEEPSPAVADADP